MTTVLRARGQPPLGQPEQSRLRAQRVSGTLNGSPLEGVGHDPAGAPAGGRLTLGQRLDSVWEGLRAGGTPPCPVCRAGVGPLVNGTAVRCGDCGSTLT
ncbi:MAG: hypothetical protein M3131_07745 [Actinomycetota bacterium]|nr:hypothetical protein [Actinomycetota bacterium]